MQSYKNGDLFETKTGELSEMAEGLQKTFDGGADHSVVGEIPDVGTSHKIFGKTVEIESVSDAGYTVVALIVEGKANGFPRPGTEHELNGLKYEVEKLSFACKRLHLKLAEPKPFSK